MPGRLTGKVAIVTGAGSGGPGWGNGKATAVVFAREGAKVLAVDLRREAAEETKAIIDGEGGTCTVFAGDMAKDRDVQAMAGACRTAFGRIDVLHNNVGIVELGGPVEASEESWDKVMQVNLKSMFLTCKHVLPTMVAQFQREGRGGRSSISARSPAFAGSACPTSRTRRARRRSASSPRRWRCSTQSRAFAATPFCPA